jgi:ATP-binding cassette subfamily C protein
VTLFKKKELDTNNIYEIVRHSFSLLDKPKKKHFLFLFIIQQLINFLDLLGIIFIAALLAVSGEKITTVNSRNFLDNVLLKTGINNEPENSTIFWLAAGSLALFLLKTFLSMLVTRLVLKILAEESSALSKQLLAKLILNNLNSQNNLFTSELVYSLSSGIPKIMFSILGVAASFISDIFLFFIIVGLLLVYDVKITAITILVFGTALFIAHKLVTKKVYTLGKVANENDLLANNIILNIYRNKKEIYVKNNSQALLNIYDEKRKKHLNSSSHLIFLQNSSRYLIEIVVPISVFVLISIQLFYESSFQETLSLGVFLVAATRLAPALIKIQGSLIVMKSVAGEVSRAVLFLKNLKQDRGEHDSSTANSVNLEGPKALEFRGVCFKYSNDEKFRIQNINFEVNQGEITAIIGASGSGKSTIVDLALGLLTQESGEIFLFGQKPGDVIKQNPGKLAYVPQDPMIIGGTIRENILLGSVNMQDNDASIIEVLAKTNLKDFVLSLDKGLDSQIGEFGVSLSGGQKQRLGIARGIISNPSLLILDEVTSALDLDSENAIKELLSSFRGKKTILLISHSKNLIEVADQVVLVSHGRIEKENTVNSP